MKQPVTPRKHRLPRVQIKIQNGRFQVPGLGSWYAYWRDPYHLLLTVPWFAFIVILVVFYLGVNALFAVLYLLQPNAIANARPGSFVDAFFFSVQTLATIGYGSMYPQTVYANAVVTVQSMIGLMSVAVATGLAFARFSRPTARVLFSNVAVVAPYNDVPTLMLRTANKRRNQVLEAQIQLYLMRDEISREGYALRRFYELKLLRHRTASFSLSWTVMHPIDEQSPFYGMTPEALIQSRVTLVASLSGIDETVMQPIYARYTYGAQDILWNHRFVDIFHDTPDGHRYLDYTCFHKTIPLH